MIGVYSDNVICHGQVYTRSEVSRVMVPYCDILGLADLLCKDYLTFANVTPLTHCFGEQGADSA